MTNTTRAVFLVACMAAAPAPAQASPILDQAFAPAELNHFAVFSELTRAQTFTVGRAGLLSRVEVLLDTAAGLPALEWPFQVIPTSAGVPVYGTAPLASFVVTLPANPGAGSVAGFYGADVSAAGLMVAPGDVLAIVSVGAVPPDMSHWWAGRFTAPPTYLGGAFYTEFFDRRGNPDGVLHSQDTSELANDLGFRTWVDDGEQDPDPDPEPIPEPGTLVLFGAGLIALRLRWARGGRRAGSAR